MRIDLSETAPDDWDEFLENHGGAPTYVRSDAVRIGASAFGLRTFFLAARDESSALVGILPLVEQSSVIFGRYLISVPFFTYGGIVAHDRGAVRSLVHRASELGSERRVAHVELRHSGEAPEVQLQERLDKVSMVLKLPEDEDALDKSFGSKLRSQIRRADREDPEIEWGGSDRLSEFYSVFSQTMHALGTPVYPKSFFDVVYEALDGFVSVLVIRVNGQVEAAAIVVRHGNELEVPWAAASLYAKRSAINMRMYRELLLFAMRSGATAFDFGRCSVDSGTYRFKAQWGAKPRQLHWHYWLARESQLPQLNQDNPKYAMAAAIWRRMPLWVANTLGPRISRHLP